MLIERAYEEHKNRTLAIKRGLEPVVPPKKNRKIQLEYNSEFYKRRNEIERF